MKRILITTAVLALLTGGAVFANSIGIKGLNFVAPTVMADPSTVVFNPTVGEIVFDAQAGIFKGFNGTTWNSLDSASSVVPTGTISAFGGTIPPSGWLLCDGSSYSRTNPLFVNLYSVIQNNFGGDNSLATFRVPDLRGRFPRGTDNMGTGAAGRDPDAGTRMASAVLGNTGNAVGSVQPDGYKSHAHSLTLPTHWGSGGMGAGARWSGANTFTGNSSATTDPLGGAETRPVNIYVNYIIKL